jgi:hypothetical protein
MFDFGRIFGDNLARRHFFRAMGQGTTGGSEGNG